MDNLIIMEQMYIDAFNKTFDSDVLNLIDATYPDYEPGITYKKFLEFVKNLQSQHKDHEAKSFIIDLVHNTCCEYLKTSNPCLLIFSKLFNLFVLMEKTDEFILYCVTNLIFIALKLIYNQQFKYVKKLVDYNTIIDYDKLINLQPQINSIIYTNFINIIVHFINHINISTNHEDYAKLILLPILLNFNDLYLFYILINNLRPEFKNIPIYIDKNCIDIYKYNNNNNNIVIYANIILLQNDYNIFSVILEPNNNVHDHNNIHNKYVINFLKKRYQETGDIFFCYKIINFTSQFRSLCFKITIKNNYFNIPFYNLINVIFTNKLYHKIQNKNNFFLTIFEYYYLKIKKVRSSNLNNEYKHILNVLLTLLEHLDVNSKGGQQVMNKITYNYQFEYVSKLILNKLIDYVLKLKYTGDFIKFIFKYIMVNLNINYIVTSTDIDFEIDENNNIINVNESIQKFKKLLLKNKNKKKIILKIPMELQLKTLDDFTTGDGALKETFSQLFKIFWNRVTCNSTSIKWENEDLKKDLYYLGLLYAYCLFLEIFNVIPNYVFKFISELNITLDDLIDSSDQILVENIKKLNPNDIEELELTMSVTEIQKNNKIIQYDLIPNGHNILVTSENAERYIKLITDYYTFKNKDSIRVSNMKAFVRGVEKIFIGLTQCKSEKKKIICDLLLSLNTYPSINRDKLIKSIDCSNLRIKEWITQYLKTNDKKTLKKFIFYTTSSNYQLINEKITIKPIMYLSSLHLPFAKTCSKMLHVPNYNDYSSFENKLNMAIHNCIGFQME